MKKFLMLLFAVFVFFFAVTATFLVAKDGTIALPFTKADATTAPQESQAAPFNTEKPQAQPTKNNEAVLDEINTNENPDKTVFRQTVTINYGQTFTNPSTGKQEPIDPYIKKFGLDDMIGKPLSVMLTQTGAENYSLNVVCGGSVIYSESIRGKAAMQSMLATLKGFLG